MTSKVPVRTRVLVILGETPCLVPALHGRLPPRPRLLHRYTSSRRGEPGPTTSHHFGFKVLERTWKGLTPVRRVWKGLEGFGRVWKGLEGFGDGVRGCQASATWKGLSLGLWIVLGAHWTSLSMGSIVSENLLTEANCSIEPASVDAGVVQT